MRRILHLRVLIHSFAYFTQKEKMYSGLVTQKKLYFCSEFIDWGSLKLYIRYIYVLKFQDETFLFCLTAT